MLSKQSLVSAFEKDYKKHYEVELFRREGFTRKKCSACAKAFWSIGSEPNCGDSSHNDYSFIKKNPGKEGYVNYWKKFASFWKKNGHEEIKRYPTICRWRDDLYFTIASIVDFQRLEKGKVVFEYPANPLIVPQVCLRFNDIANVGVTGRHLSSFTMAGQHSFNAGKDKGAYWKDECLQLNFDYLTKEMKIPKEEITYAEDLWHMPDFSAFGPSIESFSGGLELVNSVFMQFRATPSGFEELDMKVIDVGWGFERLPWYKNGTASVYDSIFAKEIEFMKKKATFDVSRDLFERYSKLSAKLDVEQVINLREEKGKIAKALGISLAEMEKTIAPLQGVYAIADHARTLLFALTDGALPSNAAGGYNLRVIARRALGFIEDYSFDFELYDVMELQAKEYKQVYPELSENLEEIREILDVEKRKFGETVVKSRAIAVEVLRKGSVTSEKMQTLYESHGLTPEIIAKVAHQDKLTMVDVPTDFYKKLTEKHVMEKKPHKEAAGFSFEQLDKLPKTELVYYKQQDLFELQAKVVAVSEKAIALDKTIFYPEGGGQCTDKGTIDGVKMGHAEKTHDIVLHHLPEGAAKKFKAGQIVKLKVDENRRHILERHHSATHLMVATCREVLGSHIWQTGSKKDEDEAHLDITHYEKPPHEVLEKIERRANERIWEAHEISWREVDRHKAEEEHGYRLYQGGGAISKKLRIVEIKGVDVEACGGTHVSNTSKICFLKIVGAEQVQDGVVRIHYKAGSKAVEYVQAQERSLKDAARELRVQDSELVNAVKKFFEEWKQKDKALEKADEMLAESYAYKLVDEAKKAGKKDIEAEVPLETKAAEKLALQVASNEGFSIILMARDGFVVAACHPNSAKDASELLKKSGARGGGSRQFARGKRI